MFDLTFAVFGLLVSCLQLCNGVIQFRNQYPHEPRIYENAPSGTFVTTIHTYNPDGPLQDVTYNLHDVLDNAYFRLESSSGNLSTKKAIDRKVNETYEIIIIAIHQGETGLHRMAVRVIRYNTFSPKFEQANYKAEVHINVTGGTPVIQVAARDNDPEDYNSEIYYLMDRNDASSFFTLNENTGNIYVRKKLMSSLNTLTFRVFAEDGGSPKRTSETNISIFVRTISEPLDVIVRNTTETSVEICWRRPLYGHVTGYLLKYEEVNLIGSASHLNLTTNASTKCTVLENVKPWTDYQFRLYAWNMRETGLGSDIVRFGTRPNFCERNICKSGDCQLISQQPGYICRCKIGYYGSKCEKFDPCSLNPCENFGGCKNVSHNMYQCVCLNGFSGPTCSIFNPCAIRPPPCLNDGKCESRQSNIYHCHCTDGYYGENCQHYNPCSSNPCLNGFCHNLSDVAFRCQCHSGFTGKFCQTDIDECAIYRCENGGTCTDGVNSFRCDCLPGYRGKKCQNIIRCPSEKVTMNKGAFQWKETQHSKVAYMDCPYGTLSSLNVTGYARRKCRLLNNGTVVWGKIDTEQCREKGYKIAEDITEQLQLLTENPNNLNAENLASAAEQIQDVVQYAVHDMAIASSMFTVISNMLAINQTVLEIADQNGDTTSKSVPIGVQLK